MRRRFFRRILKGKNGQTAVEYLLTTAARVVVFAGMYAVFQKHLGLLFKDAGVKILSTYPVEVR
ncbi:MAG: hypothetical protein HY403_00635 [Elusimicrobia bacterium]|nr:hypothetical protein [Elusimicrobiota bacterium]